MSPEMIVAIVALISALGGGIAFVWNGLQAREQQKATKELSSQTNDLQREITRLAAELDQSKAALNRARDLVNNIYLTYREMVSKVANDVIAKTDYVSMSVIVNGSIVELKAIAEVWGDDEFKREVNLFISIASEIRPNRTIDEMDEPVKYFDAAAKRLHTKIYALLQKASQ